MNIAEKLVTVAENVPKVFNAGQLSVISQSEALKGSAQGEIISITDISPVEHDIPCSVGSKNLVNLTDFDINRSITITLDTPLPAGTYTLSGLVTTTSSQGLIQAVYTDGSTSSGSMDCGYTSDANERKILASKTYPKAIAKFNIYAGFGWNASAGHTAKFVDFMIEEGSTATEYTPYVDLSTVTVKRLGKNLFDPSKFLAGSGWKKTNDGVYYGNSALLYAVYKKSTNNPIVSGVFKESTQYTISFLHRTDTNTGGITFSWEYTDGKVGEAYTSQNKSDIFELRSTTSKAGKTVKAVYLSYGNTSGSYFKDVQLEEGATTDRNRVTEFEPYNCTEYTANADGIVEGIKSLYPTTTLMTDTDGVIVSAEYIKDIDKTFNSLTTAIALTGGE